jgi:hypothetical protein
MQKILALFDRLTEKIPPHAMRLVRLGALVVWAVAGTTVIFFSWRRGRDSTPPEGQDLSRATIRERIYRERNREEAGGVTVPDLGEFFPEARSPELPSEERKREKPGLSGVDDRLIEPENPIERPADLPPFLGEDSRNEQPLHIPDVRERTLRPSAEPDMIRESEEPRQRQGEMPARRENLPGRREEKKSDLPDRSRPAARPAPGKADLLKIE